MAFERVGAIEPVGIGRIKVELVRPDPRVGETPRAHYEVAVYYNDGTIRHLSGNLVPHLTQGQIDGLLGFMDNLFDLAVTEILPTP